MGFEFDAELEDSKVAAAIDAMEEEEPVNSLDLTMVQTFGLCYSFSDNDD